MNHSSLYEINIHPQKPIPILNPPAGPDEPPTLGSVFAQIDNSPGLPVGRDLLFLTDIEVTVQGRNNTLTITWNDPSWGGLNVFTHWQISRARYPIAPGASAWFTYPVLPVGGAPMGPGSIVRNADGTLTATIVDPQLRAIGQYAVRVEPLLGANPGSAGHAIRRNLDGSPVERSEISINNRHFNLHFTQNDYIANVTMVPQLNIEQAGVQFLRLWWPHLTALEHEIAWVEVEEWPPEMGGQTPQSGMGRLGTIATYADQAFLRNNDVFIGPGIPSERRGFALAIRMRDGSEIRTEIVVFDPLVADFAPYRPEVTALDHIGNGVISMEWLAFARFPAVPAEMPLVPSDNPYRGRFVDTALVYEIFASDNWEDMERMTTPLMTVDPRQLEAGRRVSPVQPEPYPIIYDPTWALFPSNRITQYQSLTEDGIQIRNIRGNRVYFVKIRAVREPGGQASSWAYGSVYVPPLDQLILTPEMISAPPVHIAESRETSLALRWDTRYLEILKPNPTEQERRDYEERNPDRVMSHPFRDVWHTVIGAARPDTTGISRSLIFGRSAAHINFLREDRPPSETVARHRFLNDMLSEKLYNELLGIGDFPMNVNDPRDLGVFLSEARTEIEGFLAREWNYADQSVPLIPMALRLQNTENFRYQIHAVPHATVQRYPSGFEGYRAWINATDSAWTSIGQPTITNGVINHTVTGLTPNTPYMIFVRPYVIIGGQQISAAFPTFVTGTTIITPDRPTPDPTTPVLHPVPRYTTRNRIAVRWRVQDSMMYEIRVSHFFTDYSSGGTAIELSYEDIQRALDGETVELEDPRAVLDVQDYDGAPYFHLRISERFPDTVYYIWATATGVGEDGASATNPSQPSNPVDIRTHDIEPPSPPRSLSRAPQNLLNMYNRYNGTEHKNDEPDSLIVSFMRIFPDLRDENGNFNPRAEGGDSEGGDAEPLNMPNLSATEAYVAIHMVRFGDLNANRSFYVRGRTILTVRRGEADIYSYEIEISENEDFLDSTKFTIPPLESADPIDTRRAVSDWVTIELDTGFGDDEFDGVHRPDQYPTPERDFEITYDAATQTLIWRFRTNQRGEDGRLDQNVDQRFITRLIQERVFTYTVDLSEHGGRPVANREIILPETILRAFDERKINFEILAGEMNFNIPHGALNTAQMRNLQPGIGTYYHIAINSRQSGMPPLATNNSFATLPQRLAIQARTPLRTENLTTFAKPIEVVLPVENFVSPDGLRTGLFVADENSATWRDTQGRFSFANNTLTHGFQTPTTFAGITRNAPQNANDAMTRVSSRMTITDLTNFNPAREVSASELNNIVNALVNNRTSVTLGASLPADATRSLTNARLLAPQNLTREIALDIMVRLYENRTKQILTPMTTASSIPGLQNADAARHRNIRIAADIGMLTGPLEPHGKVTMGELMDMVDIIVLDAGL
jgi:hypothetical protein